MTGDAGARRFPDWIGLACVWVPYAVLTHAFRWICDDAFITFRYARNWAAGHGLRYNLGDHVPVEGYSNFLWAAICAVLERFGADMTTWPLLLSFACGSLVLWRVHHNLRFRFEIAPGPALLATAFLACCPSLFVWSTGGLETTLFALLLFLTFELLVLRRRGIPPVSAGLVGLALSLVRVEGVGWLLVLLALAAVSRSTHRASSPRSVAKGLGGAALLALGGYAVYWLARYDYYGAAFSNTATAKVSVTGASLARGAAYVGTQFVTILSLAAVVPALCMAWRPSRRAWALPAAAMALAITAFPVAVGGDWMPMGRMLVPALPFYALLVGGLLDDVWGKGGARAGVAGALGLGLVALGLPRRGTSISSP